MRIHTPSTTHRGPERRRPKTAAVQRPPVWRPQPTGLTRDEIRAIVLDTLG